MDAPAFIWIVHLQDKTRIGISFLEEDAIVNAERAIDRAVECESAGIPES